MHSLLRRLHAVCADDEALAARVNEGLAAVDGALRMFPGPQTLLSFNGGKDSVVVLHLTRVALARQLLRAAADGAEPPAMGQGDLEPALGAVGAAELDGSARGLGCVWFDAGDQFQEVSDFVAGQAAALGLSVQTLEGSYRDGMAGLVAGGARCVVMGQRVGDPYAPPELFAPSTPGWAPFMRVNPALRWTFADVWKFLRGCELPYCGMYDRGYTSIGHVDTTAPNEALRRADGSFAPAYELLDGALERCGRAGTPRKTASAVPRRLSQSAPPPRGQLPHAVALVVAASAALTGHAPAAPAALAPVAAAATTAGARLASASVVPDDSAVIAERVAALAAADTDTVLVVAEDAALAARAVVRGLRGAAEDAAAVAAAAEASPEGCAEYGVAVVMLQGRLRAAAVASVLEGRVSPDRPRARGVAVRSGAALAPAAREAGALAAVVEGGCLVAAVHGPAPPSAPGGGVPPPEALRPATDDEEHVRMWEGLWGAW